MANMRVRMNVGRIVAIKAGCGEQERRATKIKFKFKEQEQGEEVVDGNSPVQCGLHFEEAKVGDAEETILRLFRTWNI